MSGNEIYQIITTDENGVQHVVAADLTLPQAQEYYKNLMLMQAQNAFSIGMQYPQATLNQLGGHPHGIQTIRNAMAPTHSIAYQGRASSLESVITMGELEGWRLWAVNPDGEFQSMTRAYIWHDGEAQGNPYDEYGTEGVYCFKDRSEAEIHFETGRGNLAVGRVKLRGTVIEHTYGYRAEFAKIEEIVGIKGHFWPKKKYRDLIKIDPSLPGLQSPPINYAARARFWGILFLIGMMIFTALSIAQLVALLIQRGGFPWK